MSFWYSGLSVTTELIIEISILQSNLLLFEILKVVLLIFFTAALYLSAGFLPISNGPKSKRPSEIIKAFEM